MTDEFDGYRKWLGIANRKRTPTHYELLAISLDEDDPEVIRAAAEQRRHYVETKRGDGHDSVVTEILFRIGEAEATLLNDEMRRNYDRQLNLFEKRRKNRQVDPYAPHSRVSSIPGRTVGEDSGIVRTFAGIMAIVCVGFGVMAWFSFQLPWSKKPEQPIAAAPAAPVVQAVEPRTADEHAPLATPSPDALLDAQPKPSPPTEQKPQPTFLTTLPRIGLRSHPNDWWSDKGELVLGGTNGTSFIRRPLMFEGRPSPHGIYMSGLISSKVFVKYRLDGRFETFESTVHIPDMLREQGDPRTPLVFQVVADENTMLWQSNPLKKKGDHQPCVVSVKGVNVLSLKIDCQGPDNWALGAWIEPQVYGTEIAAIPPTAAASLAPPVEAKRQPAAAVNQETETNAAASSWKFWDVFGNGVKKDTLILARDGMLLSPAHNKAFCLTTLKEFAGLELKLEFQFQSAEGLGNPYLGVVSTLPNPDASDWKQQIPRSVEIKLAPQIAGELVLPTADFKVKLATGQKRQNSKHEDQAEGRHIAPINKPEVKLREWNTLEVKCSEDSKLIVKINGVTVNRLEGMQTNKGHVVIWPANAEMRLRNAVVVVDGSETKLSFETLE